MSDTDCCGADGEWDRTLGAADDTTLNQAFGLLSDQRRRYVLEELYATDEAVLAVTDLVDDALARGPHAPERERVLVDFDPRTDTVRYRGDDLIDALVAVLVEGDDVGSLP